MNKAEKLMQGVMVDAMIKAHKEGEFKLTFLTEDDRYQALKLLGAWKDMMTSAPEPARHIAAKFFDEVNPKTYGHSCEVWFFRYDKEPGLVYVAPQVGLVLEALAAKEADREKN